jgi:hypothetical protein
MEPSVRDNRVLVYVVCHTRMSARVTYGTARLRDLTRRNLL